MARSSRRSRSVRQNVVCLPEAFRHAQRKKVWISQFQGGRVIYPVRIMLSVSRHRNARGEAKEPGSIVGSEKLPTTMACKRLWQAYHAKPTRQHLTARTPKAGPPRSGFRYRNSTSRNGFWTKNLNAEAAMDSSSSFTPNSCSSTPFRTTRWYVPDRQISPALR
jgi:hypothetical protein